MPEEALGTRIRVLRLERGLTLKQLALLTGKSESYLSKLENGKINPSLSSLKRIADGLGRPLVHFFESPQPFEVVQLDGQRRRLVVSNYLEYEILSAPNPHISLFLVRLKKKGKSGMEPYAHPGIEAGIVLKGTVRIKVGDKEWVLKAGDSITYYSHEPHSFENISDEEAVGIWVVAPPTF